MENNMLVKVLERPFIRLTVVGLAWILVDCLDVQVAYQADRFAAWISVSGFPAAGVPWAAWLFGAIGVVVCARFRVDGDGDGDSSRIGRITGFIVVMTAMRLVSLIPSVGGLFPPIGVIWSPHVAWSVPLVILLIGSFDQVSRLISGRSRLVGGVMCAVFLLLYTLYALFFVRTTILHGDESQYMMIAQSLVEDGDMDLANTGPEDHKAYHQVSAVEAHKAPGSPEGKVHNIHPVGTPLILAPGYWLGDWLWGHSRLGSVLMLAVAAAVVVWMMFRLLSMGGFDSVTSGVVAAIVGVSPPLFTYSNQIYPDVLALLFSLPALAVVFGRSTFPSGYVLCAFAPTLVLPILHPRLVTMLGTLALLMLLRLRKEEAAIWMLKRAGILSGIAFVCYVGYHLNYTGDIWGAYKPGNAWKAYTPTFRGTVKAITGQWLDVKVGLLHNAPVFAFVVPGLWVMWRDGRRWDVLAVVGLFVSTAGINALSDDWRFGFCYASRFMVSSLPVLIIPVAHFLRRGLPGSPVTLFLFLLAASVGVDTTVETMALPEAAYRGDHLNDRLFASFYPLGVHFPNLANLAPIPWTDMAMWAIGIGLGCAVGKTFRTNRVVSLAVCIAIVGLSHATVDYARRMRVQTTVRLPLMKANGTAELKVNRMVRRLTARNGATSEGHTVSVRSGATQPGVVGYGALPTMVPSAYTVRLPYRAEGGGDETVGHYVIVLRKSVRAFGNHEVRHSAPLRAGSEVAPIRFVSTSGKRVVHHMVSTAGQDEFTLNRAELVINLKEIQEEVEVILDEAVNLPKPGEKRIITSLEATNLPKGHYRVRVDVSGVDPAIWFRRRSDPIMFAVFKASGDEGVRKATRWKPNRGRAMETPPPPGDSRPLVEAYLVPYWSMVPVLGEQEMQFTFENERDGHLFIVGVYSGEFDLRMDRIRLERRMFKIREGDSYVDLELSDHPD